MSKKSLDLAYMPQSSNDDDSSWTRFLNKEYLKEHHGIDADQESRQIEGDSSWTGFLNKKYFKEHYGIDVDREKRQIEGEIIKSVYKAGTFRCFSYGKVFLLGEGYYEIIYNDDLSNVEYDGYDDLSNIGYDSRYFLDLPS